VRACVRVWLTRSFE